MWRLIFIEPGHTQPEILHAILVLLLCITVLVRDSFAHFMRSCAIQQGFESEALEFTRLRTMVAAPVSVLLYIHAFFLPGKGYSTIYILISKLANLPLRTFFIIEIVFLIINFGSIAGLCRKYGTIFLDEVCHEDDMLRRRILAFFPNALTVLNALMGILAVLFAHQGWIRQAYLFLLGAAIFDKLDGALARKLGLTAPSREPQTAPRINLGGLLDDIADGISFCLAPALIFLMTISDYPVPGIEKPWPTVVAAVYFILGITRLIYFTFDRTPIPGFFKGMPTPAAALLVVAPLLMFSKAGGVSAPLTHFWGIFCFTLMIVASLAMNLYPVHYLHIGRCMDSNPWFGRFNMVLLLVSLFTPYFGYIALIYLLLYLLSPVATRRMEPR
jgi:CDP-diacylglycerol---serine O-phosphatidyltransferase